MEDEVAAGEVVADEPLIDELPAPKPSGPFRLISFAPFRHSAYARLHVLLGQVGFTPGEGGSERILELPKHRLDLDLTEFSAEALG